MIKDPRTGAEMISPRMKDTSTYPNKFPERLWKECQYEPVAGRCIMFPS